MDSWPDRARELSSQEFGLAVVFTGRHDGSPRASVVNSAVIAHPVSDEPVVAFVSRGSARKLDDLRARPTATIVFRAGWEWLAVEGDAQLVGPEDRLEGLDQNNLAVLIRTIYASAVGGTADQWSELDSVMAEERHTAVLVRPRHIYPSDNMT